MILWKVLLAKGLMENPANVLPSTILDFPSSLFILLFVGWVALGLTLLVKGIWWLGNKIMPRGK